MKVKILLAIVALLLSAGCTTESISHFEEFCHMANAEIASNPPSVVIVTLLIISFSIIFLICTLGTIFFLLVDVFYLSRQKDKEIAKLKNKLEVYDAEHKFR